MAKSSINFQKAKGHSLKHNLREDLPNYLLPKEYQGENEYWKNSKSAEEIFQEELAKYTRRGKRPKFENSHWEAVVNLNKNHSLNDVKKVAIHIQKKFNITCTAIAIHRDEGHTQKDKEGKEFAIHNYHAHINFVTVKDQQQNWTLSKTKPKLRELQTEVAQILGMERGKENSKAVRLEHRQYKAIKQAEEQKQELAKQKDLKAEVKGVREILYGAGAERSDYAELEQLAKEQREKIKAKTLTLRDLKERMEAFKNDFEKGLKDDSIELETYDKDAKKLMHTTAIEILEPAKKRTITGREYYDRNEAINSLHSFLQENNRVHRKSIDFIVKYRNLALKAKEAFIKFGKTIKEAVTTKVVRAKNRVHQQEKKLSPADKLRKEFAEKRAKSRKQGVSRS